jgi:hypothetical protein
VFLQQTSERVDTVLLEQRLEMSTVLLEQLLYFYVLRSSDAGQPKKNCQYNGLKISFSVDGRFYLKFQMANLFNAEHENRNQKCTVKLACYLSTCIDKENRKNIDQRIWKEW